MRWLRPAPIALALAVGILQFPVSARPSERPALFEIPFSSGTIDPLSDFESALPEGEDLVLVQFDEFGRPGMVDAVAATGATLVQPLAPVSYLVWADAAETTAVRALDGVRFAGVLPASARVAPSVTEATATLRITFVGSAVPAGLAVESAWTRAFTETAGTIVEAPGDLDMARVLSELANVYSVADAGGAPELRDERSTQIVTGSFDEERNPVPGYQKFLKKIKADGRRVIVSHVDTGVDFNHEDLSGRVAECIDYGISQGAACEAGNADDVIGHGTHTAGIIVGTNSSNFRDSDGFAYGQGMAPGAKVVVQNAISLHTIGFDPFENGFRPVYLDAHKVGAIVSANSWGPKGTPQGYDSDTREFDTIPRDINDKKAGDQPMAFVLSIMNGRGGKSTQGTPDEGKNLIRVGASGNRPSTGTGGPGADDLCTCTAHGPALDGRMLPDVVAPGQNVISARAAHGVVCGLPARASEVPPSPFHGACTGTSMASPHVSGGYAVFVEWYRKHFGGTPSPALVKAAFVNGAVDLSRFGGVDADGEPLKPIPNNQQGWGRFNIANTIRAWQQGVAHLDQDVVFTDSDQSFKLMVKPTNPDKPVKATLVWTDAPGHGKGGKLPAWVNDLNLVVTSGRDTWLGNVFDRGWSVTGGKADRMNNVENVYVKEPGRGVFRITIEAANIIGDGLPNRADRTDQDFAIVVTNGRFIGP